MSKRDEKFIADINATYARRDRGELTDKQWMDRLKGLHDDHKAACKAEWDKRNGGVPVSPRLCAELAAIRPLTPAEARQEYAAHLHGMTDERLAREVARLEALPGCEFRRLANDEYDARAYRAALAAAMAPPTRWTATHGGAK